MLYEDERIQLFEDEVIMTIASLNAKNVLFQLKNYTYMNIQITTPPVKKRGIGKDIGKI